MKYNSLFRASACALALAAGPALTGCSGVVKNLNADQVSVPNIKVANPFGFSNQTASVTLSNPTGQAIAAHALRKPHAGSDTNIFPFQKQTFSLSSITSATLVIALQPTVTLTGSSLPSQFTLTAFAASVEVDDLSGPGTSVGSGTTVDDSLTLPDPATSVTTSLSLASPVHFTLQSGSTNTYVADSSTPFTLQPLTVQGTDLTHLETIVTGENTNKQAIVTLSASGTGIANGTTATFTFGDTSLTVSANGS